MREWKVIESMRNKFEIKSSAYDLNYTFSFRTVFFSVHLLITNYINLLAAMHFVLFCRLPEQLDTLHMLVLWQKCHKIKYKIKLYSVYFVPINILICFPCPKHVNMFKPKEFSTKVPVY